MLDILKTSAGHLGFSQPALFLKGTIWVRLLQIHVHGLHLFLSHQTQSSTFLLSLALWLLNCPYNLSGVTTISDISNTSPCDIEFDRSNDWQTSIPFWKVTAGLFLWQIHPIRCSKGVPGGTSSGVFFAFVDKSNDIGKSMCCYAWLWVFERVRGIEPPYPAWEAGVLPLNYTRF